MLSKLWHDFVLPNLLHTFCKASCLPWHWHWREWSKKMGKIEKMRRDILWSIEISPGWRGLVFLKRRSLKRHLLASRSFHSSSISCGCKALSSGLTLKFLYIPVDPLSGGKTMKIADLDSTSFPLAVIQTSRHVSSCLNRKQCCQSWGISMYFNEDLSCHELRSNISLRKSCLFLASYTAFRQLGLYILKPLSRPLWGLLSDIPYVVVISQTDTFSSGGHEVLSQLAMLSYIPSSTSKGFFLPAWVVSHRARES